MKTTDILKIAAYKGMLKEAGPLSVDAIEDRVHRYFPDSEEQEVRDNIAREEAAHMSLRNPGATKAMWAGGAGIVGALLGAAVGHGEGVGPLTAGLGGLTAGLVGLGIGSGVVAGAKEKAVGNISRQYLRKHPEHLPQYEAVEERAREEARIKEEIARKEQQAAATRGTVLAGLAMATNAYANRTSTENKNINVNKTAAKSEALKEYDRGSAGQMPPGVAAATNIVSRAAGAAGMGLIGNALAPSFRQRTGIHPAVLGALLGAAGGGYATKRMYGWRDDRRSIYDRAREEKATRKELQKQSAADLLKEASPWAAIARVGAKAFANPLVRRAAIGAGVGGTGNMMFGSPQQGSLAKRFATGAAVGAAAGGAYHAGVRLGMPTATKMGTKAWTAAKPGVTKGINKAKGLFRGKPNIM